MKKLRIVDTFDEIHELNFPENLEEVSLNSKIAFDICREDISIWLSDSLEDESLLENRSYYLYLLSKAISEFLNYPFHKIMKFNVSDLVDETGELLPNVLKQHFEDLSKYDYDLDFENAENTLLVIYQNIVNLVESYKFEYKNSKNYIFDYKGEQWEIPYVIKKLFTGKKVFSKVSVAQCVEILQIKKFLHEKTESKKRTISDTENIQDLRFTSFLKMLAFTVKKKDEDLPLDDVEYQQLVENRMLHFKDVNVKLAYDITFFLMHITVN